MNRKERHGSERGRGSGKSDLRMRRVQPVLSVMGKSMVRGELAGIRTQDPRLKRALLYQLSYELTG
jgi:hypothetical protein